MKTIKRALLLLMLSGFLTPLLKAQNANFNYDAYAKVLKLYVIDGWVDYRALKKDPKELKAFLSQAKVLNKETFEAWSKDEQLAYYINLYNAVTLQLIVDHYPIESIKSIGNFLKGPWKQEVVPLFGEVSTLDHLEHGIIRPVGEPRIHFAINCASVGCPKIAAVPYIGKDLEQQLALAAKNFIKEENKNQINPAKGIIKLSPLFSWFKGDFEKSAGSLRQFLVSIVDKKQRDFVRSEENEIEFGDYDWNLNSVENRP